MTVEPATPASCCQMRRKVVVGVLAVLPEEACGVADAELADFLRFDLPSASNKPVLAIRYCPWCGTLRNHDEHEETRIVDPLNPPDEDVP